MDQIKSDIDEYGTVSMSAPIFVSNDSFSDFQISKDADDFYQFAQTNLTGTTSSLEKRIMALALDANVEIDAVEAAKFGYALADFENQREAVDQHRQQASETQRIKAEAAREIYNAELALIDEKTDISDGQRQKEKAEAKQRYAQTLDTVFTAPATPQFPSVDQDSSDDTTDLNNANTTEILDRVSHDGTKLAPFLEHTKTMLGLSENESLSENLKPTTRSTLFTAFGDYVTYEQLRSLLDPKRLDSKNKKIIYGMTMVSVQPGALTRENFFASVNARIAIDYEEIDLNSLEGKLEDLGHKIPEEWLVRNNIIQPNNKEDPINLENIEAVLENDEWNRLSSYWKKEEGTVDVSKRNPTPHIQIISPLTDSELFANGSSRRSQKAFALSLGLLLSKAGFNAGARTMVQHAKSLETDVAVSRPENFVSAYSMGGGLFGFEFGPRLVANADIQTKNPRNAYILDRQTFPALIVVSMDDDTDRLFFQREGGRLKVFRPKLTIYQTPGWAPTHKKSKRYRDSKRQLASEILKQNYQLTKAFDNAKKCPDLVGSLSTEWEQRLRHQRFGSFNSQYFPQNNSVDTSKVPSFAKILPEKITLKTTSNGSLKTPNQEFSIWAIGKNLKHVAFDTSIVTGGKPDAIDSPKIEQVGQESLKITFKVKELLRGVVFNFKTTDPSIARKLGSEISIKTPFLQFIESREKSSNGQSPKDHEIKISIQQSGENGQFEPLEEYTLKIPKGLSGDELNSIESILKARGGLSDTNLPDTSLIISLFETDTEGNLKKTKEVKVDSPAKIDSSIIPAIQELLKKQ